MILGALGLDLLLGDPDRSWHPVRLLGRAIQALEQKIRRNGRNLRWRGLGLLLLVAGGAYLAGLAWMQLAKLLALSLGAWCLWLAGALLLWSCLGLRSMADHLRPVLAALAANDLPSARAAVARVVGRDTAELDEAGVLRAAVETAAEGLCDGVVAPLCFAALGGPPLALAYRAVNTLDSMVGYKDERYRELGWASARFDDLLNWVPARLSALAVGLAAFFLRLDARSALRTAWTDGPKQPSPNSGWPEGAFAGALGVQLGGPVLYKGQLSEKAFLGQPFKVLGLEEARMALRLYWFSAGVVVLVLELCR